MDQLQDNNAFYRSKAARDLLAMSKEGKLIRTHVGRIHRMLQELLVEKFEKENDDDVKRFMEQLLDEVGCARLPSGGWMVQSDSESSSRVGSASKGPVIKATINTALMDGQPVFRQHNAWRTALSTSLRENRTWSGAKNMELVSIRQNGTKINRVVSFRGFVPDTEGEPKDRLYFVADARTDKAEEAAMDTEAELFWRFKMTKEKYIITGTSRTIRSYRGARKYAEMAPEKLDEEAESEHLLYYRRIAWNACSSSERQALLWPKRAEQVENKQVDNLMRMALQGLCIHPETHAAQDPSEVFKALDKDGGGTINYEELCQGLRQGKVFMGENERKQLWQYLDESGEGEAEYATFSRYMQSMEIPDHFWVMYLEPFQVERIGRGDPWGHVDEGEFEPGGWMYYLNTEGKWDAVPQVTE